MAQLNVEAMPMAVQCVSNHCTELPLTLNTAFTVGIVLRGFVTFPKKIGNVLRTNLVSRDAKPECARKELRGCLGSGFAGFVSLTFDGEVGPRAQLCLVQNRCSVKGLCMTG